MIDYRKREKSKTLAVKEALGVYAASNIKNPYDYITIATKGLSANVIKNFRDYFNLPLDKIANMLSISEPSIYRWIKADKKLEKNVSIKLFEISELFLQGANIFGNKENFFQWLELPNTAIGGMKPGELLYVPEGISKLKDILGRIEHGVFS